MEWYSMEKQLVIMKKILFISFLFSLNCSAQFLGVEVKNTLNQRFGHGSSFITPSLTFESTCVLEPSAVRVGDSIYYYYSGGCVPIAIGLATSYGLSGTLNKRGQVIGTGMAGNRNTNSSFALYTGGTFYIYAANNYTGNQAYLYTSTNGYSFTDQGVIFGSTLIPSVSSYGNMCILVDTSGAPAQIVGKYRAYVEANEGFQWMLYLLESTSLTSGWTFVQRLNSLKIGTGSWSGASAILLDGVTHMFYHYSSAGTIPTYVAYASASDGINFTQKEVPLKRFETPAYGASTDQIADQFILPYGNKVAMFAEYGRNSGGYAFTIYKWVYDGTFKQLITGLNNCIGCAGIYP